MRVAPTADPRDGLLDVTIVTRRGVVGYVDGEHLGPLPLTVAVAPGALRVAVPRSGAP